MSRFFNSVLEWLAMQEERRNPVFPGGEPEPAPALVHFDSLFDFLSAIAPSDLTRRAIEDTDRQLAALLLRERHEEQYHSQLRSLYHYFCNLHHYLKTQIDQAEKSGVVFGVSRVLETECAPELYDDEQGKMEDVQLTAKYIPIGMVERVRIYCECVCAEIFRVMPSGTLAFFTEPRPMSLIEQGQFESDLYDRSHGEVRRYQRRCGASLRHTPLSPRGPTDAPSVWNLPSPPQARALSASDRNALYKKQLQQLTFRQKWNMLSRRKKIIFLSMLAVSLVGIIAAGVFVPGSQVITIPAVGVLTAKVLAVLIGSVGLIATTASMGYVIGTIQDPGFAATLAIHTRKLRKHHTRAHLRETGFAHETPDLGDSTSVGSDGEDSPEEEPPPAPDFF